MTALSSTLNKNKTDAHFIKQNEVVNEGWFWLYGRLNKSCGSVWEVWRSVWECGDWRLEIGDWRLEIGDWRLEIGEEEGEVEFKACFAMGERGRGGELIIIQAIPPPLKSLRQPYSCSTH